MARMWWRRPATALAAAGVLLTPEALGTSLRRNGKPRAAAPPLSPAAGDETGKVERLLLDVDESIRKSASDAEYVYATLYSYDQQLQTSLDREVDKVNKELAQLKNTTTAGKKAVTPVEVVSGKPAAPEPPSDEVQKVTEERAALEQRLQAVKVVECFLHESTMEKCAPGQGDSPQHVLAKAVRTTQMLLQEHTELEHKFLDVFEAFLPKETGSNRRLKVHLTKTLKARSAQAIGLIEAMLKKKHSAVVLQQTKASEVAEARDNAKAGIEAEEEQNTQEKAFTTAFATAILRIDEAFLEKVRGSIREKADLVSEARTSRDTQHRTLHELVDLLRGKYEADGTAAGGASSGSTVGAGGQSGVSSAGAQVTKSESTDLPLAFLQTRSASQNSAGTSLEVQFEEALRKREDTHGMLMKVKAMLDEEEPIDAEGAESIAADLRGVLKELDEEHSRAADAKSRCDAQSLSADSEAESLRSNFRLMTAVRDRTQSAIRTAKKTLESIANKTQALDDSRQDYSKMVDKMVNTLQDQQRDRRTIEAAVQKAREIVNKRASSMVTPAADALLFQMLKELRKEDDTEALYRSKQATFRDAFLAYSDSYVQLLRERRGHYASSLSSLELYASEVESDLASQSGAVSSGTDLQKERKELCAGLVAMYTRQRERHAELARTLRAVVPDLPAFLSTHSAEM